MNDELSMTRMPPAQRNGELPSAIRPSALDSSIKPRNACVAGMQIHYLEAGHASDEVTLLLHGWPASSYLWRKLMPALAQEQWVVAPDLPGFGASEKPAHASYTYGFWTQFLNDFVAHLGATKVNLVVHDLSGPIGLMWAVRQPAYITRLVIMNTLVYPELHWSAKLFIWMTHTPGIKRWLTRPRSVGRFMQLGVRRKLAAADRQFYEHPYYDEAARRVLLLSVQRLAPQAAVEIAEGLPLLDVPVLGIYGKHDVPIPNIAQTMQRLQSDLPQMRVHELPDSGHFLQEDQPEVVARLMRSFLQENPGGLKSA